MALAALTYEKNNMGHMRQYQGLLAYNNSGIQRNKIEEPLVGWIVVETTRARHGGSYMALLTYKKNIHMVMIDHAIGNQMIDVIHS